MSKITIRNVKAILTAPAGINLIVVKVETSEPTIWAWMCYFCLIEKLVASMVEDYLDPLLKGRTFPT